MKKYISAVLIALIALTTFSCKKSADVDGIESKLPDVQVSSLGLPVSGPFSSTSVIQVQFGATLTKQTPATFKLEVMSGSTVFKTINFPSWNGKDDTSTGSTTNHTISYTLQPTSYPNTSIVSGVMLIKLSTLGLVAGTNYTLRATGTTVAGKTSTYTTSCIDFENSIIKAA